MITRESIQCAYSFFHQKERIYRYSTMPWQRDDIEYAIDDYSIRCRPSSMSSSPEAEPTSSVRTPVFTRTSFLPWSRWSACCSRFHWVIIGLLLGYYRVIIGLLLGQPKYTSVRQRSPACRYGKRGFLYLNVSILILWHIHQPPIPHCSFSVAKVSCPYDASRTGRRSSHWKNRRRMPLP